MCSTKDEKNSLLADQLSAVKASAYTLVIGRMCNVHKTLIRELQLTHTYGNAERFELFLQLPCSTVYQYKIYAKEAR